MSASISLNEAVRTVLTLSSTKFAAPLLAATWA